MAAFFDKILGRTGGTSHACSAVIVIFCMLVLPLVLAGCGTKKNTATSRKWQEFTTRYNVYYNGDEHYKQTLKEMERDYEDDYTRTLLTHPAEAKADPKLPQPKGDFKRTIEKMQKAIQLHSIKKKPAKKGSSKKEKEFRARDEFNPFLHNAWLMMGKAQFNNGDFLGAASTFFYITKHFTWLPNTVTEALIWQARSYCAMDWLYEAENVLHKVKPAMIADSRSLTNLYNLTQGDYLVRAEKYSEAIPYLEKAAKVAKGSQKNRLYFLLGQLYSGQKNNRKAYEAYKKAASGLSTAYRTKFNARIKQSEVYTGSNISGEVRSLRALTRYQRNKEYLDQIYYAIGNLYLSRKDTAEAKKNYIKAVEESTRDGIDKALANLALANIYFAEAEYVKAQPCYSAAVAQLNEKYPDYKLYKKRSDVLDKLAVYAGNVELQDSLLDLSRLTEEEQMKVCERLAEELKKKEKEEAEAAKREEYLASQQGNNPTFDDGAPQQFTSNADKSWYFYNTTAKNAGKTEFQRKWGSRKLEDDWRRRNKSSFSFDDLEAEEAQAQQTDSIAAADGAEPLTDEQKKKEKEAADKANDPHYAEYYFKQIPHTEQEISNCNNIVREGLYNMGLILKDNLEDYPAARREFNELDTRYPENEYRLEVYYNMYLMAVREDDAAAAEKYRELIISEFPESAYGAAMKDPQYFDHLRRMDKEQQEIYDKAYGAYLADDNAEVHELTGEMEKDYPLSPIMPKFVFIDALTYLTEKDYDKFKERLTYLLEKWPETDMTDMAGGILKGLASGRQLQSGGSNSRGLLWDMRLTNDSTLVAGADGTPAAFERDPNSPQLLVFAFPKDSVSANQVLFDVARFNFSSFTVKDFDLEPMSFGNVGLLIVRGFSNLRELEFYRSVMAEQGFTLPPQVRVIMISKPNFELLLREGRSFEEYFRFEEGAEKDAVEERILGSPDLTMPSPEDETEEDEIPDEEPPLPSDEEEPESENPDNSDNSD